MKNSDEFKLYYIALFEVHSGELFKRLWGTDLNENGVPYVDEFKLELGEIANNFSDFMLTLDVYDLYKSEDSIANYLLFQMDGLAEVHHPKGVEFIAKSMLAAIKEMAEIDGIAHPLCNEEIDAEPVVIDGDVAKNYILIQYDGYYNDEVSSQVIASSKDKRKLELLCDDRVRRLKSVAKFVGLQERYDLYNMYRQLVDEARKMKVSWKVEEVLEV